MYNIFNGILSIRHSRWLMFSVFINILLLAGLLFETRIAHDVYQKYREQNKINGTTVFLLEFLQKNQEKFNAKDIMDLFVSIQDTHKSNLVYASFEPKNKEGVFIGNIGKITLSYDESLKVNYLKFNRSDEWVRCLQY